MIIKTFLCVMLSAVRLLACADSSVASGASDCEGFPQKFSKQGAIFGTSFAKNKEVRVTYKPQYGPEVFSIVGQERHAAIKEMFAQYNYLRDTDVSDMVQAESFRGMYFSRGACEYKPFKSDFLESLCRFVVHTVSQEQRRAGDEKQTLFVFADQIFSADCMRRWRVCACDIPIKPGFLRVSAGSCALDGELVPSGQTLDDSQSLFFYCMKEREKGILLESFSVALEATRSRKQYDWETILQEFSAKDSQVIVSYKTSEKEFAVVVDPEGIELGLKLGFNGTSAIQHLNLYEHAQRVFLFGVFEHNGATVYEPFFFRIMEENCLRALCQIVENRCAAWQDARAMLDLQPQIFPDGRQERLWSVCAAGDPLTVGHLRLTIGQQALDGVLMENNNIGYKCSLFFCWWRDFLHKNSDQSIESGETIELVTHL